MFLFCFLSGISRFSSDVQAMLGKAPGLFWRVCWVAISPAFLAVRCVKYYTHISRLKLLNYNINKTTLVLSLKTIKQLTFICEILWSLIRCRPGQKRKIKKAVGHLVRRSLDFNCVTSLIILDSSLSRWNCHSYSIQSSCHTPICTMCILDAIFDHVTHCANILQIPPVPQLFSVHHSELPAQGAAADPVWLQVPGLEHHGRIHHWLFILHVDPHLHGLQAGVDSWIPQAGQRMKIRCAV